MYQRSRGAMVVVLALCYGLLPGLAPSAFGEESAGLSSLYVRESSWQGTMQTARERYQAWRTEQLGGADAVFGPWYVTNPFKMAASSDAFAPEQGIDINAKTPDGNPVWTIRNDFVNGAVHSLPGDALAAVYLTRTITVSKPLTINVGLGGDDTLTLWLNGAKVNTTDLRPGASQDASTAALALNEGENRLVLKVYNLTGSCAFYFSMQGDPVMAIWNRIKQDFPLEAGWVEHDAPDARYVEWFSLPDTTSAQEALLTQVLRDSGEAGEPLRKELAELGKLPAQDKQWLDFYVKACTFRQGMAALAQVNFPALRRAIQDLTATFPDRYTKANKLLARLDEYEKKLPKIQQHLAEGNDKGMKQVEELLALQQEALGTNPLLDFDKLLLVKRAEGNLGLPQNWQGNCAIASAGYDNEIAVLSPVCAGGTLTPFFKPEKGAFAGDLDLNFDADKILFSMPGSNNRWQIWEIQADGAGLRQVTPGEEPDVDNYDPCYLPDGRIIFASTRCFQGIPCVGGGNTVANLCRMDADGKNTRQLCFDQDHNWCPTVLNNGRVMFSRWEYSDTPHYFSRLLFNMNPDGTNQSEYYGSNSFWPNSIFYARPIPGSATQVAAIISGHHGVPRMGELVILDPAKGRFEADGVVQRIPGHGKAVEPVIMDTLVDGVWPKFLHPYPLSDKYFLVSCKPGPDSLWGIYLVDIFDNRLLLCEVPGYALLEPIPFRKTPRPAVIPDTVKLDRTDATVYLTDVYRGQGLTGVPRGTVKNLRIYEVYYTYPQMGGHVNIGVEGPWDVHRILGTVPVYEDGSAYFKIPANIPVAVQPLDDQGRAVQIMRSWFVGMPGESVSCVGCHEQQNMTPPSVPTLAARRAPVDITPWKGPARGFSFKRDVQPALDTFCVGCHDGADGKKIPDFTRKEKQGPNNFTPSYLALHPYVRRPGPESDYHIQKPLEFHASTSPLIQMLEKGHHGVKLDSDAWERLYTWIDLNVPDHGTWGEHRAIPGDFHQRRLEMRTKYANRPEDPEAIPDLKLAPATFIKPEPPAVPAHQDVTCEGWPFDGRKAVEPQQHRTVDLGNGVTLEFVLIPQGEFVMGSKDGSADEQPRAHVKIDKPFWMAVTETTNAQYAQFDPKHDSGVIDQHNKDHTTRGYPAQAPKNPVIRITWNEAMAFCQWLAQKTGEPFALPTEAQWEWACRAGTDTPLWYGGLDTDFAPFANLADKSIQRLAVAGINPQPIENPSPFEDFLPKESRFNDGERIVTETGKYQPNPWGLFDMHGNVAEWTLSTFRAYPYVSSDGRDDPATPGKKVVRGGSWFDRPKTARSAYRLAYEPWQPVYNVGFRVICPVNGTVKTAQK